MSLNVGNESSRVVVYNAAMKFNVSESIVFADLRTSHRTGGYKVNKRTGVVLLDKHNKPVPERTYTTWEGRFMGDALEAAKGLRDGTVINIINGWVDKSQKVSKGKTYTNVFVVITDFEVCNTDANEDEEDR